MKFYDRKYEKVFTEQENFLKRCDINKVSPFNNVPLNTTLYINEFKKEMRSFELDTFNHLVKIAWLMRRFCYDGERRVRHGSNGQILDTAYGLFVRNFIGYDTKFVYSNRSGIAKILTYMDDLFPNFDEGNPLEEIYEYPYEVVTLSHLVLVYQMEERMELLDYAEKKGLAYVEFLDYIINHINCHNDEIGKNEYEFIFSAHFMPYVKKMF